MTPCVGQGAPHGSCLANSRGVKKKLWVAAYVVLGSLGSTLTLRPHGMQKGNVCCFVRLTRY